MEVNYSYHSVQSTSTLQTARVAWFASEADLVYREQDFDALLTSIAIWSHWRNLTDKESDSVHLHMHVRVGVSTRSMDR